MVFRQFSVRSEVASPVRLPFHPETRFRSPLRALLYERPLLSRPLSIALFTATLPLAAVTSLNASGQTPSYPTVPAPTPVPADTFPSIPAPVPARPAQTVPTPAQVPATPATPAQVPSGPGTPGNGAPGSEPTPGASPATAAPADPLETPIRVQPAQPQQPSPVTMSPQAPVSIAPPSPVSASTLPAIKTDYEAPQTYYTDYLGSTYIPVDSPIYPMALRLYSLGYLDSAFISMRPWTRRGLLHMLEKTGAEVRDSNDQQAIAIYDSLLRELRDEVPGPAGTQTAAMTRGTVYGLHTGYTRLMGVSGLTLRDSYHLGQTIANDYGRPYESGFNNITGFSSVNEWNRFSLYVRGEYQHSPSAPGYSTDLATLLSTGDGVVPLVQQDTIPWGPLPAQNPFRLQEATLSVHLLGHEISGGKSDAWLGPAAGGAMAWSNNAENIYSFRINRVEPLHIPYFSNIFGPLRYDFFVGSLKGHTFPNDPWVHSEMFSLRPTSNFEFAFQRTVIWGGKGHVPVTLHTFFRSFFSLSDTENNPQDKNTPQDPGARFSDFSFSWRLPFLRHYVTLYTDSIAHDDVSPISAPRRAAYRPGVYISQIPGIPKLDFRIEAASTDTSTLRSVNGAFNYFEGIQRQGYTNKGFIMGDWIGREAKGGQAWLTYHLSANEWIQLEYLNKKTPKDFIPFGTTQNQFMVDVVKRLRPNLELNAWLQYEKWVAPIYKADHQSDTVVAFQFTWYPKLRTSARLNGK